MHHHRDTQPGDDLIDVDEELFAGDHDDEDRDLRSRIFGFLTSSALHVVILMALAAIFLSEDREVERPAVRTMAMVEDRPVITPPDPVDVIETPTIDITIDETPVESPAVTELDLPVAADISDDPAPDAPAFADPNDAALAALGVAGGSGGEGGFSRGGNAIGAGKGPSFMGADAGTSSAPQGRVLYIIDMSQSLKEDQLALIKHRLARSLDELTKQERYNVIFFSGPCWLPGDDPQAIRSQWQQGADWHDFTCIGDLPQPDWKRYTPSSKRSFEDYLAGLKRTGGTDWRHPFRVAYAMDPQPMVIFFLTDGAVNNSEHTVDLVAEHPDIPVFTIAFGIQDKDGIAALQKISELTKAGHIAYDQQQIAEMYSALQQEQRQDDQLPR